MPKRKKSAIVSASDGGAQAQAQAQTQTAMAASTAAVYAPPHVMKSIKKRKLMMQEKEAAAKNKKQRVAEVTEVAVDVMNKLLAPDGDVGYDVTDAEWEHLVQLTQQHPKFKKLFSFPVGDGWVTPKAKKKSSHLKVVALDCEMCVTTPVDTPYERVANSLCRVSAVDGEDLLRRVVADFIVHQPEDGQRVVDPKTDIHGIALETILQSKIHMEKMQKRMLKFINSDTIVVGHSVYGDLASMRINHRRVIDTALIFQRREGSPSRLTPGLKCLTKFLLGFEMPGGHDSTIDAQASMLAAKYAARNVTGAIIPTALELHGPRVPDNHNGNVERVKSKAEYSGPPKLLPTAFHLAGAPAKEPVNQASLIDAAAIMMEHNAAADSTTLSSSSSPDSSTEETATQFPMHVTTTPTPSTSKSEAAIARSCRLRVHRIPRGVTSSDIEKFFVQNAKVVPSVVEQIVMLPAQNRGSCNVTFSTNAHAALAFESASGVGAKAKITLDSIGRQQKTIAVVNSKGKTFKNVTLGVL